MFELAHGRHNHEKLHRTYGEWMVPLLVGTLGRCWVWKGTAGLQLKMKVVDMILVQ